MSLNFPGLSGWDLLWPGGRRVFGPVLWSPPCCETGALLPWRHGPREHEGIRWVSELLLLYFSRNARRKMRPLDCRNLFLWLSGLCRLHHRKEDASSSPVGAKLGRKQHIALPASAWASRSRSVTQMHVSLSSVLRNRGPAGGGRVRSGVQPVEEQGVRVSQLQALHRRLSLRASPGEVPGDGAEQQPHRQPQVSPSTGTSD